MLPRNFHVLAKALNDAIRKRPKRLPRAIVAFTEDADRRLGKEAVVAYAELLRTTPVPRWRVDGESSDIDALLHMLTDRFEATLDEQHMGRLRRGFPRLWTCQAALTVPQGTRSDRNRLLGHLYDELTERHPFLQDLTDPGTLPMLLTPLRLVLRKSVLRWLYGEWTRLTLNWVSETRQSFLTYISTSPQDELAGRREQILVEAFLRDLAWQLRSSIYSVGRRRRRWRYVLLFPEAHEDGAIRTFIYRCATALDTEEGEKRRIRPTPVVILAGCGDRVPVPDDLCEHIEAGDGAMKRAARALRSRRREAPPLLHVPATSPETDPSNSPCPRGRNHWFDYLYPIGNMLVTGVLAVAAVTVIVRPDLPIPRPHPSPLPPPPCANTWILPKTGERVGITDGNCQLSADRRLTGVEAIIAAQNEQVATLHHPYRTVVFLSPLTVPLRSGRPGQDSLDELRGVALAQDSAFQTAKNDSSLVPIKVLLANTGDRFAAGPAVAGRVVALAKSDNTLEAVIGISQSRRESHQAIQQLASRQLPIIGSTTTSDQILDSSPLYYEIVPRNAREAETIAQFLAHQPIAAGAHGEMVRAKKAVVVEDPRDEYSQNLATDFRRSFTALGNEIVTTFDYGPTDKDHPMIRDPEGIDDTPVGSADQLVQDLCNTIGNAPDLVFYASRAQDFAAVLDKVEPTSECQNRELAVMGSDENARFVADGTIDVSRYTAVRFYDAAFSDLAELSTPVAQQFAKEYEKRFGESVNDSGAVDAYDAFNAAAKAIDLAYQQDPSIPPGVVASKMRDGLVHFNGVTGFIAFDGQHDTTRVPPDKPIFVVEERPKGPKTLLACGRYADGGEWSTWGDGFPCPHD
jgi:ABC-type branched-subunit amino acid transport system substrate-binding protein